MKNDINQQIMKMDKNKGEKRIFISANSPGEIAGWLMPVVRELKMRLPEYKISVILLPCIFASGRERNVVEKIPGIDEVIPERSFISLLFDRSDKQGTELLYLGGDITFTAWLAKCWKITAWGYQWGKKSIDNYYRGYFVKAQRDKEVLEKRGISSAKIHIVGDLIKDRITNEISILPGGKSPPRIETICFMPGSRLKEVCSLLPFYLHIASILKETHDYLNFKALISPFIDWNELVKIGEIAPLKELGGLSGVIDSQKRIFAHDNKAAISLINENHIQEMATSDFIVTIPGTKTGEAGCLGKPMIVLLPLNKPEDITYKGLVGMLDMVPVIGPKIKACVIRKMARNFSEKISLPNITASREVVPEVIGIINARDTTRMISELIDNSEKLEQMRVELREIYTPFEGAAKRLVDIFARAVEPGIE